MASLRPEQPPPALPPRKPVPLLHCHPIARPPSIIRFAIPQGSGKTHAYGLPIIHHILGQPNRSKKTKQRLNSLILALQVAAHLTLHLEAQAPQNNTDEDEDKAAETVTNEEGEYDMRFAITAIVGEMSVQKQWRVLNRGIEVLVATPGRLWDILEDVRIYSHRRPLSGRQWAAVTQDDELAKQIRGLKFLVVDGADHMAEAGHFEELEHIFQLTFRKSRCALRRKDRNRFRGPSPAHTNVAKTKTITPGGEMQTFVFSATLGKDLQRNVTKRARPRIGGKKEEGPTTCSPKGDVVSPLKEGQIECLSAAKYSYYFLLRYLGRSLVFLSSIDGIQGLMPPAELLGVRYFLYYIVSSKLTKNNANALRFKSTSNSVLLATDIAPRGPDIPAVATTSTTRSCGRCVRLPERADSKDDAQGPQHAHVRARQTATCKGAAGGPVSARETDVLEMSMNMLDKLQAHVALARKTDLVYQKAKKSHDKNWIKEAVEAMELQLDSDFVSDDEDDEDRSTKFKVKSRNMCTAAMEAELKRMLTELIAKGVLTRLLSFAFLILREVRYGLLADLFWPS
ncbi:hypothetical protein FIBSPDRAFT_1048080 [Athelia psychrophila]|uniref:ATP-dependent RNA helicase n=1 Tax=Athelia psychrophila TaxID=1759441 RepID=A0A166E5S3_9AGAM|nr:hypothetical protein FIBSPDRAFT_1048080 [Fibularhizoctonia sp. CBS 109695]